MRAEEFAPGSQDLVIFDIDDTLLHTTAKIKVVKAGRVIRDLTNQEFNNYQLQPGEEFDFGEFRSAEKFRRESQPIESMLRKLKTILAHASNAKVIMLTARADFDDKDTFLQTFRNLGVDMSRVHVHRAGNIPGPQEPAYKKAVWVRQYLDTGRYGHVRLYDDSKTNLRVFKDLEKEYTQVDFRAIYVGPEGQTQVMPEDAVVTEIERIRARDYQGGKYEIEYLAKSSGLAPLPGGSGLLYNVQGNKHFPMIMIWDPRGPDAQPNRPQPIGKLSLESADRRVPIPGALQVASITVDEDYRGRGIARSLYGIVLSIMRRPLIAGEMQTPGGRQNWVSLAQIPGVEVRGFVSIDDSTIDADQLYGDNIRGKNFIDTLMGRLGAEYIGQTPNDQHVFAFDVRPGRSEKEMEAVVNTTLSRVYNEHPDVMSGLYAVWTGA
jgi:FMN phosphatase YigB (HAD superfamily)